MFCLKYYQVHSVRIAIAALLWINRKHTLLVPLPVSLPLPCPLLLLLPERIIAVLSEQLCCIQGDGKAQGSSDKQLEAVVSIYKQAQVTTHAQQEWQQQ